MNPQIVLTLFYFVVSKFTNYKLYDIINPEKTVAIKRRHITKQYINRHKMNS